MSAVVDIDGVIADATHREHHLHSRPPDWAAFFAAVDGDALLPEGLAVVQALSVENEIVLLTGRPEEIRVQTEVWLAAHGVPYSLLVMRSRDDRRPAPIFKREALARWAPTDVRVVLDDDPRVVETLVEFGFPARLVRPTP